MTSLKASELNPCLLPIITLDGFSKPFDSSEIVVDRPYFIVHFVVDGKVDKFIMQEDETIINIVNYIFKDRSFSDVSIAYYAIKDSFYVEQLMYVQPKTVLDNKQLLHQYSI